MVAKTPREFMQLHGMHMSYREVCTVWKAAIASMEARRRRRPMPVQQRKVEPLYYTPSYVEPINSIVLKLNEIICALNTMEATS